MPKGPPRRVHCVPRSQPPYQVKVYKHIVPKKMLRSPYSSPAAKIDAGLVQADIDPTSKGQAESARSITDSLSFPSGNFTYCLTLFPKFFSSFPHGTCSLSVSPLYLALDGIYHPFRAAFPNNSTLGERITKLRAFQTMKGTITLYGAMFQWT